VDAKDLQEFAMRVDTMLSEPTSDSDFAKVLECGRQLLLLSEFELADELRIAKPAYAEWLKGYSLPHTSLRATYLRHLISLAESRLQEQREPSQSDEYEHEDGEHQDDERIVAATG